FHRDLVGLDLEQVVAGLDRVPRRLEPLRDLALRHGLAELRHQHIHLGFSPLRPWPLGRCVGWVEHTARLRASSTRYGETHHIAVSNRRGGFRFRSTHPTILLHHVTEMYCVSKNSIRPSCAPSRPMPDCFMPPNGAAGSETRPRLRPIMPKSSCSETRMPRLMSLV